jgi:hypothetical protein
MDHEKSDIIKHATPFVMNEEAFKNRLKQFENPINAKIFYCDFDGKGSTLVNIGYGFLLNSDHKRPTAEDLWRDFEVSSFGWNENFVGAPIARYLSPNKGQIEENFFKAYDEKWDVHKSSKNSTVKIKDDAIINALFDLKYKNYVNMSAMWYNKISEHDTNPSRALKLQPETLSNFNLGQAIKADYVLFPTWDSLPNNLKWVVIDICYNAGAGNEKQGNGLHAYKKLKRALKTGDFDLAIDNCKCGTREDRNYFKKQIIYETRLEAGFRYENTMLG